MIFNRGDNSNEIHFQTRQSFQGAAWEMLLRLTQYEVRLQPLRHRKRRFQPWRINKQAACFREKHAAFFSCRPTKSYVSAGKNLQKICLQSCHLRFSGAIYLCVSTRARDTSVGCDTVSGVTSYSILTAVRRNMLFQAEGQRLSCGMRRGWKRYSHLRQ